MFERFTDRARKVMTLAGQEAVRLRHEYVGTEHLLLGLLKEGSGVGANVLKYMDVSIHDVRLEVEKLVRTGEIEVAIGKLRQTPRAKKVIEHAVLEARAFNHNYVGTEHLLLGLMRETGGVATQVLAQLGKRIEDVRDVVRNLLGESPAGTAWPAPAPVEMGADPPVSMLVLDDGTSVAFSDLASQVLVHANQEALRCKHKMIDTHHILLGLIQVGNGVAAFVLDNLRADLLTVRFRVEMFAPSRLEEEAAAGTLPQAYGAKQVLELAVDEARNLQDECVDTEHLLLGLLRVGRRRRGQGPRQPEPRGERRA